MLIGVLVSYFIGRKLTCILYYPTPSTLSAAAVSQVCYANLLNHQVHKLVNHQKSESRDQSLKLAFDDDQFVATVRSIAPELWKHVCKLTQSVNECKGHSAS